jgi:hypothetical protein
MLFAWYNRLVFNWAGSDARGVDMGEDSDSGIEDVILQMEDFQIDDDEFEGTGQVVIFLFSIINLSTYKANRSLRHQCGLLKKAQQAQPLMYTIMQSHMK